MSLGQRIKSRRLDLEMTQAELAHPEFSKSYISYLERDKREPSTETLQILARKLKVPISYFLSDIIEDTVQRFDTLVNNAMAAIVADAPEQAKPLLDDAWSLHNMVKNQASISRYHRAQALWYDSQGNYYLALHQLLIGSEAVADEPTEVWALYYDIGRILHKLHQLDEAQHYLEQAIINLSKSHGSEEEFGYVYYALACVLLEQGDLTNAISIYDKGTEHSTNPKQRLLSLVGLSRALKQAGQPERALKTSQQARILAEDMQEKSLLTHTYLLLSSLFISQKEYDLSADALRKAKDAAQNACDEILQAEVTITQARLLAARGENYAATTILTDFIQKPAAENNAALQQHHMQAHLMLSQLLKQEEPQLALEYALQAADYARSTQQQKLLVQALTLACQTYEQLGQLDQALQAAMEALSCQDTRRDLLRHL